MDGEATALDENLEEVPDGELIGISIQWDGTGVFAVQDGPQPLPLPWAQFCSNLGMETVKQLISKKALETIVLLVDVQGERLEPLPLWGGIIDENDLQVLWPAKTDDSTSFVHSLPDQQACTEPLDFQEGNGEEEAEISSQGTIEDPTLFERLPKCFQSQNQFPVNTFAQEL
ncbi:hypothetical protein N0V90_012836 [Kalmusia sp. IMI 367209]|nr:hypothetical protein N0V90_012836 [Kalmusia sp. IMI 367209]